jgi:hypothetical protein
MQFVGSAIGSLNSPAYHQRNSAAINCGQVMQDLRAKVINADADPDALASLGRFCPAASTLTS